MTQVEEMICKVDSMIAEEEERLKKLKLIRQALILLQDMEDDGK